MKCVGMVIAITGVVLVCALPAEAQTYVVVPKPQTQLQTPDIAGNAMRAFREGQEQRARALQMQQQQQEMQQAQDRSDEEQQAQYAAAERQRQLGAIAAQLFKAKTAKERSDLLAQMAAFDPVMALRYQRMLESQASH